MDYFTPHTFTIPPLTGISQKTIDEHMKLYLGYAKFANYITQELKTETDTYKKGELFRRFAFEFNGMKNHEIYFSSLEGGPHPLTPESTLLSLLEKEWGSFDAWYTEFSLLALTRGIGWAMLYYDAQTGHLVHQWVDEQHLGHLSGLSPVLALDMWEHSYVSDYQPSGKKQYIEDFFKNINWNVIEDRFKKLS